MEQLFASFKPDSSEPNTGSYDPKDPDSYAAYIQALIRDSNDFEMSTLAGQRDYLQKLYYGLIPTLSGQDQSNWSDRQVLPSPDATFDEILQVPDGDQANRSSFVATDVRDAIMLMLPSLIRLFGASQSPVYLAPRTAADSDKAEQATSYVNYVFWKDNPGFILLYGAFKDALTVKGGFLKWWTDTRRERSRKKFANLSPVEVQMLLGDDPTAKVLEHTGVDPVTGRIGEIVFEYEKSKPIIKVAGVPPEEMRIDRYARTWRDSRIVGHRRLVPVDQLIAMGYPRELCEQYIQGQTTPEFTMEEQLRNPGRYMSTRVGDGVMYGEWYIKIDKDDDGWPELRRICTMGENHEIVDDEETNRVRFAYFTCDPRSHTIIGDSIADYVEDLQKFDTNMSRGMLDSLAESINPKTVINELVVDVDDASNDDLGAIIRTRGDPSQTVMFANIPFAGQAVLPVLEYMRDVMQRRTGLSDAAKGLDPKALQSSTQIGVEAIINGAQERTELVARVLCETGFKDLFEGLYNEICEAPNQRRSLRLNGKWTDYDTSTFDATMGVEVNETLGKGSDLARMMTLTQVKQNQEMIMQQFGPTNPVCGVNEYLNTIEDMLSISNIKNVERYFKRPPPQVLQALAAQPQEPNPMLLAAQASLEKVKADQAKTQGQQQLDAQKIVLDDQFRHAQLREKAAYDMNKAAVDRSLAGMGHAQNMGKIAADLFKTHIDADQEDQRMAMEHQHAQMEDATARAKIASEERQAQMQAAAAAQRPQGTPQ